MIYFQARLTEKKLQLVSMILSSTLLVFIPCTKINGQVFNVEYVMTVVTHSHPKDHIAYAEFNSLFGQGKTINKRHNIYILMHTHCCLHKVLDSIAHSSFQQILFMSLRHLDVCKVLSQLIKIEKIFAIDTDGTETNVVFADNLL